MAGKLQKPRAALQNRQTGRRTAGTILEITSRDTPAPPMPRAPGGKWLKATRDLWSEFWASPIAGAVDRQSDAPRLFRWLVLWDEWGRALRSFRKHRLATGSTGQVVINPLGKYLLELERQLERTEERFGLSPLDRMRLGITFGEARRSLADLNEELEVDDEGDYELPEGYEVADGG